MTIYGTSFVEKSCVFGKNSISLHAFLVFLFIHLHLLYISMLMMLSERRKFSDLGREIGQLLLRKGWTVASAESLTGGTIASMIAQIAGSSAYFKGSVVSYAVSVKEQVLGVDVNRGGVVSEETALQMAEGVARVCQTDCAVATTGIAGPGGAEPGKPVGTVCMAALTPRGIVSRTYHFEGDREAVILQSADAALRLLKEKLLENEEKQGMIFA